jgi:hypothetical protein
MSDPDIAVALLQLFCRDEALVGDILEEFELRRSRGWLWRQVAVAVIFSLPYGMVRPPRHVPKMPMPIGGLGVVAVIALITIVAPGAWWFIALGAGGGATLGIALVVTSRRKAERQPAAPRHVLLD